MPITISLSSGNDTSHPGRTAGTVATTGSVALSSGLIIQSSGRSVVDLIHQLQGQ